MNKIYINLKVKQDKLNRLNIDINLLFFSKTNKELLDLKLNQYKIALQDLKQYKKEYNLK